MFSCECSWTITPNIKQVTPTNISLITKVKSQEKFPEMFAKCLDGCFSESNISLFSLAFGTWCKQSNLLLLLGGFFDKVK